jgi:hypothetical protein
MTTGNRRFSDGKTHIADGDGKVWVFNPQNGPVRIPHTSKAYRFALTCALARRYGKRVRA